MGTNYLPNIILFIFGKLNYTTTLVSLRYSEYFSERNALLKLPLKNNI